MIHKWFEVIPIIWGYSYNPVIWGYCPCEILPAWEFSSLASNSLGVPIIAHLPIIVREWLADFSKQLKNDSLRLLICAYLEKNVLGIATSINPNKVMGRLAILSC